MLLHQRRILRPTPPPPPPTFEDPLSLPVWLVDNVTHEATEIPCEPATRQVNYLATEVADTLSILSRVSGAPVALVNLIAYMADICTNHAVDTHDLVVGNAPLDREYLRFVVPISSTPHLEVLSSSLVIECVSHDQGWASDDADNHSYKNCWSWVEFEVVDVSNGSVVLPRQEMCRNLRASKPFRRHRLRVTDKAILDRLRPGCHVVLHLRAEFNAWSNHARYASISLRQWWGLRDEESAVISSR
ncbi:hypothetical protein H257_04862 [Aphanomyces astaci]|uniref:Uncharacterized protein n=1 Tax=Aphanomyces astaci TaxID=112090 RepID=W4GVU6_APHAT|nr:hypothetical protein H257_04862 [Aphanomyces astaci]ETV83139.1 hypothetical protein H257_04862 [Aphanomyces astaci]|eukprot:XP_009827810.1 hypothetical protein H257_04862 [Aphanomyces astaci]